MLVNLTANVYSGMTKHSLPHIVSASLKQLAGMLQQVSSLKKLHVLEIPASSKASLFADSMIEISSSSPPPAMNCFIPN